MSNTEFLFCSFLAIISGFCTQIPGFALKSAHTSTTTDRFTTNVVIWCLWVAVSGWIVRDIRVMHYEVVRVLRTGGGSGFVVDMTRAAT